MWVRNLSNQLHSSWMSREESPAPDPRPHAVRTRARRSLCHSGLWWPLMVAALWFEAVFDFMTLQPTLGAHTCLTTLN